MAGFGGVRGGRLFAPRHSGSLTQMVTRHANERASREEWLTRVNAA